MSEPRSGVTAWWALGGLLLAGSLGLSFGLGLAPSPGVAAWDVNRRLMWAEPWRWWTSAGVHVSAAHLWANVAGLVAVLIWGTVARLPLRSALAWFIAWPMSVLLLPLDASWVRAVGLSGVLHAGVAVAALHLALDHRGAARLIGMLVWSGLVVKVLVENLAGVAPLAGAPGWSVSTALHASGVVAGTLATLLLRVIGQARQTAALRRSLSATATATASDRPLP